MSDLSDGLKAASEAIAKRTQESPGEPVIVGGNDEPGLPFLDEMKEFYDEQILKKVRRVYRQHLGCEPFESPSDAMCKITDNMLFGLVPVAINALSDGVQFGQKNSPTYKKFDFLNRLADLFNNTGFRNESMMFALRLADDQEAKQFVTEYLVGTVGCLGSSTGYAHCDGDNVNKIWDLWILSMKSVCMALYAVGNELGGMWAQEDVLQGILQASMEVE